MRISRLFVVGMGLALTGWTGTARGVLFVDTGDPLFNTTAPGGAYADSGWQFLGYYGAYLGTAISPQHFITAQHFGTQGGLFVQDSLFTGGATVSHTIDLSANGGQGYWDIAGSDLRIYQITGSSFASFAELYLGSGVGEEVVMTGRGGQRGSEVLGPLGETRGWEHTSTGIAARWGTNELTGTAGSGVGTKWVARFDGSGGTLFEAGLSEGDSGGGMFIQDGGVWKLAGVNYSIDGLFDTNNVIGDGSEFAASLTDFGGFWVGSDATGWSLVPDLPSNQASGLYFSSVTANAAAIQSIIAVPEPTGAGLVGLVLAGVALRRRRR